MKQCTKCGILKDPHSSGTKCKTCADKHFVSTGHFQNWDSWDQFSRITGAVHLNSGPSNKRGLFGIRVMYELERHV